MERDCLVGGDITVGFSFAAENFGVEGCSDDAGDEGIVVIIRVIALWDLEELTLAMMVMMACAIELAFLFGL